MNSLDHAEEKFNKIAKETNDSKEYIVTEEDSKIKIINRILIECLNWSFSNLECEKKHDSGYSDYVLKVNGKPNLLIEAKRKGILDIDILNKEKPVQLKISGSALKKSFEGIQQAFRYASEEGLNIAILTDGFAWIIFKPNVVGDSYKNKEAIVFPTLESIKNSFSYFYELLSYENFSRKVYNIKFDEIHNTRHTLSTPLNAAFEPDEIKLLPKSALSLDLEKIFNGFFTQITGDNNQELLTECFVESTESRIADYSLEKITLSILSDIQKDNSAGHGLSELIQGNVNTELPLEADMSVFIVGPTGSGKTTYIDRFFSSVLPHHLRSCCLKIGINCLNATGDLNSSTSWLTEELIVEFERNLFSSGHASYEDLLGMYFGTYKRMSESVYKKIYQNNRDQFDEKFSEHLEKETQNNREGYLSKLIDFTIKNRRKLPIIVIDNTDEFSIEFKTKIFQMCHALRRKARHCMLMFPVTDKSAWTFSKTDIFTIHPSRSFFLPTPSPREVFRKRIDYLNKKLINSEESERKVYLTNRGIKIAFDNLQRFAQVLEDIFVNENHTARTLGEITNYNIRSIMVLSKRIITSPVIKIEDLVTSYVNNSPLNFKKFIDALIRGSYEQFKISTGDDFGIIPIFRVNAERIYSPLLPLRILALLRAIKYTGRNIDEQHLSVLSIANYFDSIGCDAIHIQTCLSEMISLKLLEPFDPSISVVSDSQKIAITYKGLAHYELSTRNSIYFYQMALTTAITNPETSGNIRSLYKNKQRNHESTFLIKKIFSDYLINEDKKFISDSHQQQHFESQHELLRGIKNFSVEHTSDSPHPDIGRLIANNQQLTAIVERYDLEKCTGLLAIEDLNIQLAFNRSTTITDGYDSICQNDIVNCTIAQSERDLVIKSINGLTEGRNSIFYEICEVKVFKEQKGYGFAEIGSTSNVAFFHKTAFPHEVVLQIKPGFKFNAEVRTTNDGKYQIRKFVKTSP